MSGPDKDHDIRDSTPNSTGPDRAAGGMGVSSERVGPAGPGQHATDGIREVGISEEDPDPPPEQSSGGPEPKPDDPTPPVAGFPARDPRSEDHPYEAPPEV